MNVERIRKEFADALKNFEYVELHPTYDGKVYARAALQTPSQMYVVSIRFPETYPNEMPRVSVDAPPIAHAPHRYNTTLHSSSGAPRSG
jgi:ubiquitin-protein ligase